MSPWYFLGGFIFGDVVYDVLNALGLHWLTWPVISLLVAFAVGVTVNRRRAERRDKRS